MSEQWPASRWGIEYPGPRRVRTGIDPNPYVCPWPTERQARERAAREPAVRLMRKNDNGEWVPADE